MNIDWSNAPKDYDLFLEFNDDHKKFVNGTEGEFARFNGDVYLMEFGGYRTRVEVERMFIVHRRPAAPNWSGGHVDASSYYPMGEQASDYVVSAWNGEGWPPVGTKCEWLDESSSKRWLPVEIVFASYWVLVARDENPHPDGSVDISFDLVKENPKFRPARTPEQIRDEAVRRMANAIKDCPTDLDRAAVLYMQGYRKTEG